MILLNISHRSNRQRVICVLKIIEDQETSGVEKFFIRAIA